MVAELAAVDMECLGRANSAAISVHFDEWRFRRRKVAAYGKQLPPRQRRRSLARLRVRAAGGGVDSCVATGIEEFADEEDFVKAGGSERLFVRMQERKPMEKQSKIAEKVSFLALISSIFMLPVTCWDEVNLRIYVVCLVLLNLVNVNSSCMRQSDELLKERIALSASLPLVCQRRIALKDVSE